MLFNIREESLEKESSANHGYNHGAVADPKSQRAYFKRNSSIDYSFDDDGGGAAESNRLALNDDHHSSVEESQHNMSFRDSMDLLRVAPLPPSEPLRCADEVQGRGRE